MHFSSDIAALTASLPDTTPLRSLLAASRRGVVWPGGLWYADGEMVRSAYTLRTDDDDWGQAGTMVRVVLDDVARDRLLDNIVGHLLNGVSEPVLNRAFTYWRNVDKDLGDRVESGVRPKQNDTDPHAETQGNPALATNQAKA